MWPASLLAPAIAFALLAAHFFRAANVAGLAVSLLLLVLLLVKRPYAARIAQIGLVLGATEWVRSAVMLVEERVAAGAPYVRLASILAAVALFTLVAALAFRSRRMMARYRLGPVA
jgi:hypothetical protein